MDFCLEKEPPHALCKHRRMTIDASCRTQGACATDMKAMHSALLASSSVHAMMQCFTCAQQRD